MDSLISSHVRYTRRKAANMQDITVCWTEKKWSPGRGCDNVSTGCKNCSDSVEKLFLEISGCPLELRAVKLSGMLGASAWAQ